jgi:hypothetical protein
MEKLAVVFSHARSIMTISSSKKHEVNSDTSAIEQQAPSLEERLAFIKLPIDERRRILANQAEKMLTHYQQNTEWQELMSGDISEYYPR